MKNLVVNNFHNCGVFTSFVGRGVISISVGKTIVIWSNYFIHSYICKQRGTLKILLNP